MSSPHYIQVPRGGDLSPDIEQSTSSSVQMSTWLRESQKEMPWHAIDSVAASRAQNKTNTDSTDTPSETPATQGSNKENS
ncbi:hypothetical protein F53441_12558 [Fusarium austroafricanum]|uniref:Uncharacterized protein n=1 Tax=Fusarium austroafricanum TaxID=2364996 RepID=A0A8H4JWP1_9HYPO|nr:hypothetical protein F53441_12558 [Fusarium austroafricanum]